MINGVDFLLNANLGYRVALGDRVVVVGGGNVAIDVARTALRYATPREAASLPGGAEQLLHTWGYDNAFIDAARTALRLGARHVQLVSLEVADARCPPTPTRCGRPRKKASRSLPAAGPKAILGKDGRVVALETLDVASVFDEHGRFNPDVRAGHASGGSTPTRSSSPSASSPTRPAWPADPEIEITPRGLVAVDPATLATTMPGVYCGGDLAFGPRIVIEAVADGKRAALAIHESLGGGTVPRARARFRPIELEPRRRSLRPDPAPAGAGAAGRAAHRLSRGGGGLRRGAGAHGGVALPVVQRRDDLRLRALHPLQRRASRSARRPA